MRPFVLARDVDASGVSGTGIVAEGVEFGDGVVVLRWLGGFPTSVMFHDKGVESLEAVHGHEGRTRVVFIEDLPAEMQANYHRSENERED